MDTQMNSEGLMTMSKERLDTLRQAVNTNNFHQAELEFIKIWNDFGRQVLEGLLEEQAPVKKKRQEICDLIRRHYAKQ